MYINTRVRQFTCTCTCTLLLLGTLVSSFLGTVGGMNTSVSSSTLTVLFLTNVSLGYVLLHTGRLTC